MNFEQLQKTHGDKANELWAKLCALGGFGNVPINSEGGLDLISLDDKTKKEVDKLLTVKGDK